jgi:hypothetical protein
MQIRIRQSLLLLVLIMPLISTQLRAQSYAIAEMSDEYTTATRPFSISRVASFSGGLRLFVTLHSEAVPSLLEDGTLIGQLSDHNTLTVAFVPLALGKTVTCTMYSLPIYTFYKDTFPYCGPRLPYRVEIFIRATVTLGPGRDLAIGQDPDFMWLIEEQ